MADSTGVTLWTGDDYGFGANTYVSSACIPPGCHVDRRRLWRGRPSPRRLLAPQNATGDTLALIPQGTNFGESIAFDVCATTPAIYNPWEGNNNDVDETQRAPNRVKPLPWRPEWRWLHPSLDLLDFLVVFGLLAALTAHNPSSSRPK